MLEGLCGADLNGRRDVLSHCVVFWEFVLDFVAVMRMTDDEKDLEIMLLRQQLRIVERRQGRGPHIPFWQKVPLAVLAHRLKQNSQQAKEKLEPVMNFHR